MPRLVFNCLLLLWFVASHALLTACGSTTQTDDVKPKSRANSGPRTYKGRVIAPVMTAFGGGAEWLERRDRDASEQPERVIDALKIAPDSTIADVGAGTGYFSLRIAKRLTDGGKVLAVDVQPEMLRRLSENMKNTAIKNIQSILATPTDSKLPRNQVDLALMVDVYHELEDPERSVAQIRRALKDDGRLVLVEYRAEDPDVPIRPEHKTTLRQIRYEIEPMGFRLKEVFEFLPHQHVEVFVKDEARGEEVIIDPMGFPTIRKPGWAGVASSKPYEDAGFKALFNGRDLDGWIGDLEHWKVQRGMMIGNPPATDAAPMPLLSRDSFGNFELDLQWHAATTDSTALIWLGGDERLAVRLDDGVPFAPDYPKNIAKRRTAELTAANGNQIHATTDTANALVMPGEWNRLTLRRSADRIRIAINGVETASVGVEMDGHRGPIGLGVICGSVMFREMWLNAQEK